MNVLRATLIATFPAAVLFDTNAASSPQTITSASAQVRNGKIEGALGASFLLDRHAKKLGGAPTGLLLIS